MSGKSDVAQRRPWAGVQAPFARTFGQFGRDEDGVMFIFAFVIFMLMLLVSGIAVDVARMEAHRIKLQNTIDAAVLAAADLDQPREPEDVVNDYMAKAGLGAQLDTITVSESLLHKRVEATASSDVPTLFLHMSGVDSLSAPGAGGAEERISDLEISLVVDISGSMGHNSRLTHLKAAANGFFDTVVKNDLNTNGQSGGTTMVSIVPYTHVVNVGPNLLKYFNATNWHTQSYCVHFERADFSVVPITTTQKLVRIAHYGWNDNDYKWPRLYQTECDDDTTARILPFETNKQTMKNFINALSADGRTAVDLGFKWGAALVDPAVRTVVNQRITATETDSSVQNWPTDYGTDDTSKIIVLMTDGENTSQYDIKSEFKTTDGTNAAMSPVWWSPSYGASKARDGYFVRFDNNNVWERWYRPRSEWKTSDDQFWHENNLPSDAYQLSWQDVWVNYFVYDAATYFFYYSDPDGYWRKNCRNCSSYWYGDIPQIYYDAYYAEEVYADNDEADIRLKASCDAAKLKDITIYTIAYQAPAAGVTVMNYCATTAGHAYTVSNSNGINYAFQSIASNINHLRLIQ
ncbi:MAG: Tad domain-containing protein [Pseudomonadota bacterium]